MRIVLALALAAAPAPLFAQEQARTEARPAAPSSPAEAHVAELRTEASQAFNRGRFDEALRLSRAALAYAGRNLGADHPLTFQSLNDVAVIHQIENRFDASLPLALQAAGGLERVAGPDDPETLNALANLAQLYVRMNRGAEAEPLLRRVYETRLRTMSLNDARTLDALLELAIFLNRQQRLAEITADLDRGVVAARTSLGEDSSQARDLASAAAEAREPS